jgi:hypothetical protein
MVSNSTSQSSAANEARPKKLLVPSARAAGKEDPEGVKAESSNFVLNLLYSYIGMDESSNARCLLSKDAMAAMIQGMQMLYDWAAHTSNWHVGPDGTATANPLIDNIGVAWLRKKHRVNLAEAGRTSRRAMPITEEYVCKHLRLLLRDDPQEDKRAWVLHAAWVVGLHCGLRFDELFMLQFDSISLGQCVRITLPFRTKNSITHKTYDLNDWFCPDLDESHAVDAISAVPLADYSCLWGWPYLLQYLSDRSR